jgi:hypothetical protein
MSWGSGFLGFPINKKKIVTNFVEEGSSQLWLQMVQ